MSLADLSDEAFDTLSPMQKLEAVMKRFQKPLDSILKLLDMIGSTLNHGSSTEWELLAKKVGITGEAFTYLTFVILGAMVITMKLWKVFGVGGKIIAHLATKGGLLGKVFTALSSSTKTVSGGLMSVGKAAAANAKGFLALGAAVMMVGAGIGLAAFGLASLVASFKDLDAGEIVGALLSIILVMAGFVAIILALGVAAGTAGPFVAAFLGALALAMLAIGAAILGATYGMSLLIDSFSVLVATLATLPIDIILGLIGAIATLATLGVFAGIGLGAIAVGLLAIGAALIFITDNEIDLLARLFESIGSVTLEASQAIADLATNLNNLTGVEVPVQINTLMKDLGEIPDSQGLRSAATFVKAISETKPEAAAAADAVIKQAINLAVTKADSGATELLDVLSKLLENSNEAASQQSAATTTQSSKNQRPLEIVVNIDGRGAWKSVRPYYISELKGKS